MNYIKLFTDFINEKYILSDLQEFIKKCLNLNQIKNNLNFSKVISDIDFNKIEDIINVNQILVTNGKHKQVVKLSKIISDNEPFKIEEITKIVNAYYLEDSTTFELMSGKGSQKYFRQTNDKERGSHYLKNDCMRFDTCQKYFKILEYNPEVISVLYSFRKSYDTDDACGFVLIFKSEDGTTYYDRIYGYDIEDAILLELECVKRGFVNAYKVNDIITIKLNKANFKEYPYFDTFCYLNIKTKTLCNHYSNEFNKDIIILHSTTGLHTYIAPTDYFA